jgi:hypothetical protein
VLITPPPSPLENLETAWAACSEPDREAFALKVYEEYFEWQRFKGEPEKQPVAPPMNGSAVIEDSDDEPADWWLEINKGTNTGKSK